VSVSTRTRARRCVLFRGLTSGAHRRSKSQEAINRYQTDTRPNVEDAVAQLVWTKAQALFNADRTEEAIDLCDLLITRYGSTSRLDTMMCVAQALLYKGTALAEGGRKEKEAATVVYNQLTRWFSKATEAPLRQIVASGLGSCAEVFLELDRPNDALAKYHPLDEMLSELNREVCPQFQPRHLSTEDHLPEFLAEPFRFLRIISSSKAFGEFKKCLLLLLSCFESLFNKFNQHTVSTEPSIFRHAPDLSGYLRREGDALTDGLFFGCHDTIMHHTGANMLKRNSNRSGRVRS
jgi:hypothetical protein